MICRAALLHPASIVIALTIAACSSNTAVSPPGGAVVAPSSASPLPASPPTAQAAAPSADRPGGPAPSAVASAGAPTPAPPPASAEPAAAPAVAQPPEAPLPPVKVANIGMHIGGGPNDDVTKDPIRRSVQPHFDEFRRCFAKVDDAKKAGDFGVDLRIDRAGGKARVSHPRTTLKGKDFKACVLSTFEGIDFLRPKGGTTTVSYSLRFTPLGA